MQDRRSQNDDRTVEDSIRDDVPNTAWYGASIAPRFKPLCVHVGAACYWQYHYSTDSLFRSSTALPGVWSLAINAHLAAANGCSGSTSSSDCGSVPDLFASMKLNLPHPLQHSGNHGPTNGLYRRIGRLSAQCSVRYSGMHYDSIPAEPSHTNTHTQTRAL